MIIHFYLRYATAYGENLSITGNCAELGDGDTAKAWPMQYLNHDFWHAEVDIAATPGQVVEYAYLFHKKNGDTLREWGNDRLIILDDGPQDFLDVWSEASLTEHTFLTTPFRRIFFPEKNEPRAPQALHGSASYELRVKAPQLKPNETVVVLGSCDALGNWAPNRAVPMQRQGVYWVAQLPLAGAHFPLAYKYALVDRDTGTIVEWESGTNRLLRTENRDCMTVKNDGFARFVHPLWRGAGVAVPIFSLRTERGLGVGEFTDLRELGDWAASVGLRVVQILPINDTSATGTWMDSYPYAAVSAFALHPLYLNVEGMAGKKHAKLVAPFLKKKSALNALPQVDYEASLAEKWRAIEAVYAVEKKSFRADAEYLAYYQQNQSWLLPYAAFRTLAQQFGTVEFPSWPQHATYDADAIALMNTPAHPDYDAVGKFLFVQWQLHLQLKAGVDYLHGKGLAVKGDIPIGIYRYSADAWTAPHLYNMNRQAGAPPDDFAAAGQNWGFPTYNWARMKADGFAWWRQRFEQMSHYFDAFRIDHILGFFRIWSIPLHAVQGIFGHFVPAIALEEGEFHRAGIGFHHDRLCKPHINDGILWEMFGEEMEAVKSKFLRGNGFGSYYFDSAYDTQRKLEAHFAAHEEKSDAQEALLLKLYNLLANVILLEEEGEVRGKYHFRIRMDQTSSFQQLDPYVQSRLRILYDDYFYRRQDDFWQKEAMEKLPALKQATEMLICGEDLGMVPNCVPDVMHDLAILSLEIQRMPKATNVRFFHPKTAPYLSVVTPSTHDMSPLRGWWEEDRGLTQDFYQKEMGYWGEAPAHLSPQLAQEIVAMHLWSPAMLAIFQFQDLFCMDAALSQGDPDMERINVPANPKHYWRYRIPLSLDALLSEKQDFNALVRNMVGASGR